MKIALFGGTFDPIHIGHLAVAKAAADRFKLDRVVFIPSGRPPHKNTGPLASYEHRFRMAQIACRDDVRFTASRLEDPARVGHGKSYSIDTIETVLAKLDPSDELFFLIGQDAFEELPIWHRLGDVIEMIAFIVATRPHSGPPAELQGVAAGARRRSLDGVDVPVSATAIRERLHGGGDVSNDLPPGVAGYINSRSLYR